MRSIEQVSPKKLQNNVARGILRVGLPLADTTVLEGAGQIVAVCDTGLDKGSTTNVHPAFKGRVSKLYALGRPGKKNDPDGHGTHVAGSVLGDGDSPTLGIKVRGTAPKAKLVLQSVLDSGGGLGGLPVDLRKLFDKPYTTDKARVHTNSWSNTTGDGEYNSECHDLDEFVWNHRDMVDLLRRRQRGCRPRRQRSDQPQLHQAAEHREELHHGRGDGEQPSDKDADLWKRVAE